MCVYGQVPLLSNWNYHSNVNWLYAYKNEKLNNKINKKSQKWNVLFHWEEQVGGQFQNEAMVLQEAVKSDEKRMHRGGYLGLDLGSDSYESFHKGEIE